MLGKKIHSKVVGVLPSAIYQLLSHACNIEIIVQLCIVKIVEKVVWYCSTIEKENVQVYSTLTGQ